MSTSFSPQCPLPRTHNDAILMAHGGGGTAMHALLEEVFFKRFSPGDAPERHDAALLEVAGARLAFTTDSFVVQPLFFPGGDIGRLAVCGTLNDLAMAGARPLALSAGFILEEGLDRALLGRIVESMQEEAEAAGVRIATGDTKVVERGKGDGVYINTAGVGLVPPERQVSPARIRPGDAILLNGDLGRHGIAVMAQREGLSFETPISSDVQSLAGGVEALFDAGIDVHCLRDCTRGGLASTLNELAAGRRLRIEETAVPANDAVEGACELLGLDPLYVANEGRFVAFVPAEQADTALAALAGAGGDDWQPARIGSVGQEQDGLVVLRTAFGPERILAMLSGEQLPRIC